MSDVKLTSEEQSICAKIDNLPALKARWDKALHQNFADRPKAYKMLSTALWWHRNELIASAMRGRLKLAS